MIILTQHIRNLFVLSLITFVTTAMVWALPAMAQSERTLTVQGQGTASARPDLAVIRSGVVSHATNPSDAITANNLAVSKLFSIARDFGVADQDMQTSHFGLNPEYKPRDDQNPPQISGYRVSNQYTVRVRDLTKLGKLLDELVRGGANQISGIAFEVEDTSTLYNEARRTAVADAKMRAATYAKEFSVTIGAPISIVDNSSVAGAPIMFRTMSTEMAGRVPVAPGEGSVSANVTVVFSFQ